jgi:aminoglycoside phosphotransferase (APT) family kinase protein
MDPAQTAIPEIAIDLALARKMLARVAPRIEPFAIERPDRGRFSGAIFFIDAASGPPLVIKVYPREPWWRMAKEFYVAGLMSHAPGVLAPHFLGADDSCELLPYRYSVMTRLEGERLALCEELMSEAELARVWGEVGAQMRLIHQVAMDAFGYIADGKLALRADDNPAYMDRLWSAKLREFRELSGDESLAAAMDQIWRERRELLELCAAPKLCHYDIHPGNLMAMREGGAWRLTGLIDFEDSYAGDPLLDLAKCVHFARLRGGARWRGLLEGYGAIDRPAWKETIDLYRLYQAIEYWDWIAFLRRPQSECDAVLAAIRGMVDGF